MEAKIISIFFGYYFNLILHLQTWNNTSILLIFCQHQADVGLTSMTHTFFFYLNKDIYIYIYIYTAQDMKAHTEELHTYIRLTNNKFIITQIGTIFNTYNFASWNKPTYTHRTCMLPYMHIYICTYTCTYIPAYGCMNIGTYINEHTCIFTCCIQQVLEPGSSRP
jgi:hypothetical protein